MNKFASIAWFLLLSPTLELTQDQLVMTCEEAFDGILYLDDQVFLEIEEDDFEDNQLVIETKEGGIYTLFNDEGEMVERVILKDDKTHIAFNEIIQAKKDQQYLFQKAPTTLIVSEKEDDRYESEFKDGYYYYEFETETIEFLEEKYELYVDCTKPSVSLEAFYLENEDLYFTSNKDITLYYEDECPEPFVLYPEKEIQITLQEGINDLSSYLKDQANLSSKEKLWVILDKQAPYLDVESLMYISQPKTFEIKEPYLNFKKSKLVINGKTQELTNRQFEINQSAKVEVFLEDYAGNIQEYTFDVIYDDVSPLFYKELTGSKLHLSYSEPLKYSTLKIQGTDEIIHHDYTFSDEGIYILEGQIIDYAGNKTDVYESIRVDLYEPELSMTKPTQTYVEVPTIQVSGSDRFDLDWKIEVLRNDEVYTTFQGTGNFKQDILLDESEFKEAQGKYEINVYVSDGMYEKRIVESYVVDLYCAPLDIKVDGFKANQVKELLVNREIQLDFDCREAKPIYRLYQGDQLLKEGEDSSLILTSEDQYTSLEILVEDSFGHTNRQIIQLTYPTLPTVFFDQEANEPVEEVEKEDLKIEVSEQIETKPIVNEVIKETPKQNNIGGWLIGVIVVSIFAVGKVRFRKNRDDSTCEKTVLFESQEDTILLDHSETRDK